MSYEFTDRMAERLKQEADDRDDQINDLAETMCRELIHSVMTKGLDAPVSFKETTETLWGKYDGKGELQTHRRAAFVREIIIDDTFGVIAMNALILIAKKGDVDAIAAIRKIATQAVNDIAVSKVDA
jgi:hypothetical protein